MRTDPTFWILARASGLTAYLLITCSTLAGIALKSRPFGKTPKPTSVTEIHRFLALLSVAAIALHGLALLNDTSIHIDPFGLLVPARIPYRPLWTGAGIVAAELTLVIYASFSVRKLIRIRNWRRLHWLTYAVFAMVTAHGLLAGTDSNYTWTRAIYLASIGAVALAISWRTLTAIAPTPRRTRQAIKLDRQPEPATPRLESTASPPQLERV